MKVWDVRQKGEPVATMAPEEGESTRDCWSVCFGDAYTSEERAVAAGWDNGDVKIFDLRSMAVRWGCYILLYSFQVVHVGYFKNQDLIVIMLLV